MIRFVCHSLLAGVILLAGCSTSKESASSDAIPTATVEAARARWADATPETLEQGRHIYLSSCNRCHAYPNINEHAEDEWPRIMRSMGKKARLTEDQTQLVERYVIAVRASSVER